MTPSWFTGAILDGRSEKGLALNGELPRRFQMGLYQRVRPTDFDDVLGQDHVVNPLRKMLEEEKLPELILLGGPTGSGKTTIARIIRSKLGIKEPPNPNFIELNAATDGGVDDVRKIKHTAQYLPMGGDYRMWLIDEVHQSSRQFQEAFLKETEDAPKHAKFVFCTTDPDKLIPTLRNRAHRFDLRPLLHDDVMELLRSTMSSEDIDISKAVMEEITASCEGSARQALVMLEQAWAAKDEEQALEIVQRASPNRESINFVQVLLKEKWPEAAEAIKSLEMEPERVRRGIMSYMANVLLNNPRNQKAARILKVFQFPFIHGKSDLVLATYEFFHTSW